MKRHEGDYLKQGGVLSSNRRKKLLAKGHPAGAIDLTIAAISAGLSEAGSPASF